MFHVKRTTYSKSSKDVSRETWCICEKQDEDPWGKTVEEKKYSLPMPCSSPAIERSYVSRETFNCTSFHR